MESLTSFLNLNNLLVLFLVLVIFVGFFKNRTQYYLNKLWDSHNVRVKNIVLFSLLTLLIYFVGQNLYYYANLVFITDQWVANVLYLGLVAFDILFLYYQILFYSKTNRRKNLEA